ncbi:hypothetical protein [Calothrix sp. CCY 0018]|uniref:hypothetical protein n=1 Tax=Calothrix sp. CCY 0018 TaxID=3103864 RepID=UPI0039C5ACEA
MFNKLAKTNCRPQQLKSTQFKQANIIFFGIYLLAFFMLLAAWLQSEVQFSVLFRDVFVAASVEPYYGLFSNIGIFLWSATAAILLFSGTVLFSVKQSHKYSKFLLSFGSFTLLLVIDDFFMLHEKIFPYYLKISEKMTFLAYGIIFIYLVLKFRDTILDNHFTIFAIAISFLFLSITVDQILPTDSFIFQKDDTYFFEDSLKLIGIISWCFYFIKISGEQVISLLKR